MSHYQKVKNKIISPKQLENLISGWKQAGERIVFTNGCFDIIHQGHIDYLSKAADKGTKLIIGVNTDSSVSRIKGPNRPIQDEYSRMMILAAMEFVDALILFDEETPINLINQVIPNILVKGSDYKAEDIVGYDTVVNNGGKVETLDFLPGYSTSSIEQKIKNSK
jgi:rfaE bifunctional protein nucleotidyltransferase chain/domain